MAFLSRYFSSKDKAELPEKTKNLKRLKKKILITAGVLFGFAVASNILLLRVNSLTNLSEVLQLLSMGFLVYD